ncbi:dynein heavy chain 7 [Haematococcus lacustris]|uniref:Dynein heavy chain 7 n=1 Tax=Haematococcus lacustris TaxID=44745 RepID=A0A699ZBS1_HAELA|nr:dynein heavy chain 7 [Haematococcus lacustris]
MLRLEERVEELAQEANTTVHPDFRLWLTSMPSKVFPVLVLQNGIKLTNQPPQGVKANLTRTYNDLTQEILDSCPAKPTEWRKLLFSLAFFHAVMQERRKFGPLGWNIRYEFNTSDLECSTMTLRNFLTEQEQVPWPALEYVVGQINYGGRVTDDLDRRCLMSILRQYMTPRVLDPSYRITPVSGTYYIPEDGPLESYSRDEAAVGLFDRTASGQLNSLSVVLGQEMDRFNRLTSNMASSLAELQKAIKGLVVMSAELEAMYNSMLINVVPELWARYAYPSLKPLASWVKDYQERMAAMRAWLSGGPPPTFWLPGFFFPQDGIYISGLWIDGARWDSAAGCLVESLPGAMYAPLPVIHFFPERDYEPPGDQYQCPLYKTSVRAGLLSTTGQSTNYVLSVSLPVRPGTEEDVWVLQGVALLCMLDD